MGISINNKSTHYVSQQISAAPLALTDAADIYHLVQANRTLLTEFLPWVSSVTDIGSAEQYILHRIEGGMPGAAWFKLLVDNQIVGVFGIKSIYQEKSRAEIGYWLDERFHGQGIISQTIHYFQQYLTHQQVHTLMICCLSENTASIKLAKKLGFKLIKVQRSYMKQAEHHQDMHIFHLIA